MRFALAIEKPKKASSAKTLEIDSLIIQSPLLKAALGDILQGYPGILTEVTRLKFAAPFECFVHRWEELEEALHDEERDETTRDHLKLLHSILSEDLGHLIQLRKDYFKQKAIAFEQAWFLFTPGTTILTAVHGQRVAARFNSGEYVDTQCGRVYSLSCTYIDWDGRRLGWVTTSTQIPAYQGVVSFSQLSSYPLEFHPDADAVKTALTERGRRWEALMGFRYKAYNGIALYSPDGKRLSRERVSCRVVIDCARWEDENPNHLIYLDTIHEAATHEADYQMPPLTSYQALLASPLVRGYALKNKRWMQFYVDNVHEIDFQEGAFASLVLSQERKDMILSFAQSQVKNRDSFDDVVRGKGKGIIMLLSGGPGIGKTLTAEVVAEEMRVPLYTMSAGDLGGDADAVDESLGKLMGMVSDWNAVLLLDECDVFLEARTANDLARNRIVSIFLRTLEYYQGILFLTTNRIANMDAAFDSRIHVTLEYPDLDATARRTIWKAFLDREAASVAADDNGGGDTVRISEEEFDRLAGIVINGRQIKNIMKMAKLLSMQNGQALAYRHVQTVLQVQGHYEK